MQTKFDAAQLSDPATAAAAAAIRGCVHCGFCTATCPTYVLLGNELDSPRGRIYLIKEMLERGALPSAPVVKHLDRCLSCLACETHCPSADGQWVSHARHDKQRSKCFTTGADGSAPLSSISLIR